MGQRGMERDKGALQKWRKQQQGEKKRGSRKKEREDRDGQRTGSRMEMQEKPGMGSTTEGE